MLNTTEVAMIAWCLGGGVECLIAGSHELIMRDVGIRGNGSDLDDARFEKLGRMEGSYTSLIQCDGSRAKGIDGAHESVVSGRTNEFLVICYPVPI
jgi:hypothetical protein